MEFSKMLADEKELNAYDMHEPSQIEAFSKEDISNDPLIKNREFNVQDMHEAPHSQTIQIQMKKVKSHLVPMVKFIWKRILLCPKA